MLYMKSQNQPFNKKGCTQMSDISVNTQGYHIPDIATTVHMLHGHTDPSFCICVPTHSQLQLLLHVLSHMKETTMPTKSVIHSKYMTCTYG